MSLYFLGFKKAGANTSKFINNTLPTQQNIKNKKISVFYIPCFDENYNI